MEPDPHRIARTAEHRSDLSGAELLPRVEGQHFAVGVSQRAKGDCKLGEALCRVPCDRLALRPLMAQSLGKLRPSSRAATLIGQHPAGDGVEPEVRLAPRRVVEASPCHEERLGDDIRRFLGGRGPAQHIAEDPSVMLSPNRLKVRTTNLGGRWARVRDVIHIPLHVRPIAGISQQMANRAQPTA